MKTSIVRCIGQVGFDLNIGNAFCLYTSGNACFERILRIFVCVFFFEFRYKECSRQSGMAKSVYFRLAKSLSEGKNGNVIEAEG